MPDIRDLHEEFARLERDIPDGYQSPVVAQRVNELLNPARRPARGPRPWAVASTALLAAAAVVVIAVAGVTISHRGDHTAPGTVGPSTGQTVPNPSASTTPPPNRQSSLQTSPPNSADAMPANSSALLAYVRGGRAVKLSDYQQAEPGPGQAMRPTPGTAEFNTPSGNITCVIMQSAPDPTVSCEAQQHAFPIPPKPSDCQLNWAGYFGFSGPGEVTVGACVGGPEFGPTTMTLNYGSTLQQGGIACRSESGYLACADLASGHGFAVNRTTLKQY